MEFDIARVVAYPAVLIAILLWSLVWKGFALWRAARRGEKGWFVALLVINTLGILEILYLFVFSRKEMHPEKAISG